MSPTESKYLLLQPNGRILFSQVTTASPRAVPTVAILPTPQPLRVCNPTCEGLANHSQRHFLSVQDLNAAANGSPRSVHPANQMSLGERPRLQRRHHSSRAPKAKNPCKWTNCPEREVSAFVHTCTTVIRVPIAATPTIHFCQLSRCCGAASFGTTDANYFVVSIGEDYFVNVLHYSECA